MFAKGDERLGVAQKYDKKKGKDKKKKSGAKEKPKKGDKKKKSKDKKSKEAEKEISVCQTQTASAMQSEKKDIGEVDVEMDTQQSVMQPEDKPAEQKMTKKEAAIAGGAVKNKNDYPTFQDVASDWDSDKQKKTKGDKDKTKSKTADVRGSKEDVNKGDA